MRSQITFDEHPKGVKVGIFETAPEIEKLKSKGHNLGSATLPVRQFIPKPNQRFEDAIEDKVLRIIERIKDGDS